jgi:tripartite-type tricarboxylate transporter receptor subunit TctC
VASAVADGHTLLFSAVGALLVRPMLYRRLDFDPLTAFAPVALVATDTSALVVSPGVRFATVQELIDYAASHPGKLNYGSAIGIGPHVMMELFKLKTGTNILHVPYKGGGPVITDLLGSQIDMTINNKSVLLPLLQEHKLEALAVVSAARWPQLPHVPTMAEIGIADLPSDVWMGIVAPSGTPAAVVEQLNSAVNDCLQLTGLRENFAKIGIEPKTGTAQEFGVLIVEDAKKWGKMIAATGMKID